MAFKMNKPSMVQGTKRYRDAIKAIKINREASSNKTKEGRAKYWKAHYNTELGKGTVEHYLKANE